METLEQEFSKYADKERISKLQFNTLLNIVGVITELQTKEEIIDFFDKSGLGSEVNKNIKEYLNSKKKSETLVDAELILLFTKKLNEMVESCYYSENEEIRNYWRNSYDNDCQWIYEELA